MRSCRFSASTSNEQNEYIINENFLCPANKLKSRLKYKSRHGTYRPTLPKLIASNTTEMVRVATKDGFAHYAKSPSDITTVLEKISEPLKGIGPATASLLLAIHDPDHVIFFSDEGYRWLCAYGEKSSPKYTAKEFEDLFQKAKSLMSKLHVSPIDVEKVAFVLIKENEPVPEPKPKKVPSGLPRGRPTKPESEKKTKKPTVPGRGRGRPPKATNGTAPKTPTALEEVKKRGRPARKAAVISKEEDDDEDGDEDEISALPRTAKRKAEDTPKSTPATKRGRKPKTQKPA